MSLDIAVDIPKRGFSFINCDRNAALVRKGYVPPKPRKTGTTIAGIIFKDGVVLGADTRATDSSIVAEKNCSKIHFLANNMYCCGAGTAADTEMTTKLISTNLELHRLNTGREVPVVAAETMLKQMLYRYHGNISAALIVGGVDKYGSHIYSIHPHGSSDKLTYATMGSGSLNAMAVFEDRWKPDLTRRQAQLLVRDAIMAGIYNDLGSGSNVDICVIEKNSVEYIRPFEAVEERGSKFDYVFKPDSLVIESVEIIDEKPAPVESMEG